MLKIADKNIELLNIFYLHWNVHEILGLDVRSQPQQSFHQEGSFDR